MKQLTLISKSLHLQILKFILIGVQAFHLLITTEHSIAYIRNERYVFVFETQIEVAMMINVLRFLSPSVYMSKIDTYFQTALSFRNGHYMLLVGRWPIHVLYHNVFPKHHRPVKIHSTM